jgi:hypothetical protein
MGTVDRTLFLLKHGNDLLILQIYVDDIVVSPVVKLGVVESFTTPVGPDI